MQSRCGATVVVGRWVSKGIVVRTANLVFNRLLAVQRDRVIEVLPENSQVVESENVVSVVVGEHCGVDKVNPFPNQLKPKFRRRVNKEGPLGRFNRDTAPTTVVFGVVGITDLAVAPDHRDANTCSGAQQHQVPRGGISHSSIAFVGGRIVGIVGRHRVNRGGVFIGSGGDRLRGTVVRLSLSLC